VSHRRAQHFLDRDGTSNIDHHCVCRQEGWLSIDGAIELLQVLKADGFALANQSRIAHSKCPICRRSGPSRF